MKANQAIAAAAGTGLLVIGFILYNGPGAESGLESGSPKSKRVIHEALMVRPVSKKVQPTDRGPAGIPATLRDDAPPAPVFRNSFKSPVSVLETLFTRDRPVGSDGSVDRTQIVRARFKYPLIRIEQRISPTGSLLSQQEMVADHVVVQLQDGATQSDLESVLARQTSFTAYVRHAARTPGLFLVAFDGTDPAAMSRVIRSLESENHVVAHSEPDLIVRAF